MNKENKLTLPQEEHEEKVAQVTDMITAEDLVEQAVYAANAPKCCNDKEQAKIMLNMLGANIIDSDIYHTPDEHKKTVEESNDRKIKVKIRENEFELTPELFLYVVYDFMGNQQYNIGINLYCESENGLEPFALITKNFCEFIGYKYTAYIDTNNCPFVTQLLEQDIAEDTGFTKLSGFCSYPLWRFNEDFLKSVNGRLCDLYSEEYDEYMRSMFPCDDIEEQEQKM